MLVCIATPTAIIIGMGKAASNGVLFKSGDAMEILRSLLQYLTRLVH